MVGADGSVLEGTQTNFYAVLGGSLVTAERGILKGTVRAVVLDVCRTHNIPVRLEAPNMSSIHEWEGAFISSTSRLLIPVGEIWNIRNDGSKTCLQKFDPISAFCDRLDKLVAADVDSESEPIFLEGPEYSKL